MSSLPQIRGRPIKYVEFCAGAGGTRAGLDAANWECLLAIDNDPDAVDVHSLAYGDISLRDIEEISPDDIPDADVWVAGFPCQPFSTSGTKLGFEHRHGNVFEHLAGLIQAKRPGVVLLENVEGILKNKSGHTFSKILMSLCELGYEVDWLLINLRWFRVPQTRPRLFIVAYQNDIVSRGGLKTLGRDLFGADLASRNLFSPLLENMKIDSKVRYQGSLGEVESIRRPEIGKPKVQERTPFGALGSASKDHFHSFDLVPTETFGLSTDLGSLVAPNFAARSEIRSARYYARGAPTKLCLRKDPVSHCVGTSLGGAPLYGVPLQNVKTKRDRASFLEFSNWHREQDGVLVMRLSPERAVLLFGPHTDDLHKALTGSKVSATRKHKLVGNIVAPVCAKEVAELITRTSFRSCENAEPMRA